MKIVDTKITIRWGSEEDSFFWFDELVTIDPTFDIAVDLVNIKLSQIYTMSFEPYFRQTVRVHRPASHGQRHELSRFPLSNSFLNPVLDNVTVGFPSLGPCCPEFNSQHVKVVTDGHIRARYVSLLQCPTPSA